MPECAVSLLRSRCRGKPKHAATRQTWGIREHPSLGQRAEGFALDVWETGQWREFHDGHSIGTQRLVQTESLVRHKLRLGITKAAACPALSEVGVFREGSKKLAQLLEIHIRRCSALFAFRKACL